MRLIEVVYALLPAYIANMAAPFAKFWPGWNAPISRRWLGDHKTVVGFLLGVVAAVLTSYIQTLGSWPLPDLEAPTWLVAGCAQGLGAMTGAHVIVNHVACRLKIRDTKW